MAGHAIEKLSFQAQHDRGIFAQGSGPVNFTGKEKGNLAGILNEAIARFQDRRGEVTP